MSACFLGECDCSMNFIRHYDSQGNLSCHQQYLQGPCQDGQELIQPQLEEGETEIKNSVCIPTDCGPNQIHIMNNKCVDVIQCSEDEDLLLDLTENHEKTTCISQFDKLFGKLEAHRKKNFVKSTTYLVILVVKPLH